MDIEEKYDGTDEIRREKIVKLRREIFDALQILKSHGYSHSDIHDGNVVDCGEGSIPQYKLIDFGNMEKIIDGVSRQDRDDEYRFKRYFNKSLHDALNTECSHKYDKIKKYFHTLRKNFVVW